MIRKNFQIAEFFFSLVLNTFFTLEIILAKESHLCSSGMHANYLIHRDRAVYDLFLMIDKSFDFFNFSSTAKQRHSLMVSSAPILATISPSGDIDIISTLLWCPIKSAIGVMSGYRHTVS
ncbi:hypothetical protein BpHYR1_019722 [Brachionus plicatilis]|uniref:Uncharacterized protein n=1 Tax=Brachionus plicatilis TaxID=10195 RepID=A0A3M7PXU9_BRAPC|nr:hypothetical protein BpHYR1_019722 [Brachionus plicatilis]